MKARQTKKPDSLVSIRYRRKDGTLWEHRFKTEPRIQRITPRSFSVQSRDGRPIARMFPGRELYYVNAPKKKRRHTRKGARRAAKKNPLLALYGGNPDMARRLPPRGKGGRFKKGGGGGRKRRASHNPPARRRSRSRKYRRARRNPPSIARGLGGMVPPVKQVLAGVGGAAAVRVLPNLARRFLPSVPTEGIAGVGVRLATAIIGGQIAKMLFGADVGKGVTLGGLIVVGDELNRSFVLPQVGLEAYLQPDMGAYLPGRALDAYLSPGAGVGALPSGDDEDFGGMSGMGAEGLDLARWQR